MSDIDSAVRAERRKRLVTWLAVALIATAALLLVAIFRPAIPDDRDAVACRYRYSRALTLAESLLVDTYRPTRGKSSSVGLTCAELRVARGHR
jgi:hypothetical protein